MTNETTQEENAILGGGGGVRKPKVTVPDVGGTLAGPIVGAWRAQARKWDSKLRRGTDLKYWTADNQPTTDVTDRPMMDDFVIIQAFAPTADDPGTRSFCLSNKATVRAQRKEINERTGGMKIGGHLTITRPEADRPNKPGDLASQQLVLSYLTPEDVMLAGDAIAAPAAPKVVDPDNPFAA